MRTVLLTTVVFAGLVFCTFALRSDIQPALPLEVLANWCGAGPLSPPEQRFAWPPQCGQPFPNLELVDQEGNLTRLADYRGSILLIEPIGMPCKACQAFAGGHRRGGFRGVRPQPGIPALDEAARTYGGFDLHDERIVKVHLLLYSSTMGAPTPEDARAWAEHFGLERSRNQIVLAGLPGMMGRESYEMIPGVQLVDQDFVLCVDSTGRSKQRHDLYRELLPRAAALLSAVRLATQSEVDALQDD